MNIIFDKVIINNFLSIGEAEAELSEQGFVLVSGKNKETSTTQSNGSGKSTIFDSIFWTLTGETLRGASEVVNERRKSEGCLCELQFHTVSSTYKIVRTKSHKEFGNSCRFYIDDELVSDQSRKSQEMIERMIPLVLTPEVLGSIILLGQGLPYKFTSFNPSKRKELLETMSGSSTEIDKVKFKLDAEECDHRQKYELSKSEVTKNQGIIQGLQSTSELLRSQIESVKTPEQIAEETKAQEEEIIKLNHCLEETKESYDNDTKLLDQLTTEVEALTTDLTQYKSAYTLVSNQLASIKSGNCPTCGRAYEVSEDSLRQQQIFLNKQQSLNNIILEKEALINQKNQQRSTLREATVLESGTISSLNHRIEVAKNALDQLSKQSDEVSTLQSQLDKNEDSIKGVNVLVHNHNILIDQEQEYLDCIGYLKRQLSRDFKGYMLEEVITYLSSRAEYYSNYLFTTESKIKVTLSGNKILVSVGDRLYENLSGGERQRVDLAVQFALRDILVTTSGFSCNLLVLDEAFDNLDAQGSSSLIDLVVNEFADVDSVFVVTHHADIDIPYDKRIVVVKDTDGISGLRS